MKKFLVLFLALALVAGFSTTSFAVITGSAHDFSGFPNARGEICLPCHAPHNNALGITDAPLWNHEVTQAVYTTYTSPTMDAGTPPGDFVAKRAAMAWICDGTQNPCLHLRRPWEGTAMQPCPKRRCVSTPMGSPETG